MTRRPHHHPRRRAAAGRGLRAALAAAEVHRDRARAGVIRLEEQIAEREALGISTEAASAHLSRLRVDLDRAEAEINAARRALGLERTA